MCRHDITGSEAGALFGLHRYLTPAQLYANKVASSEADDASNAVQTRGMRLEPFVASIVQDRIGPMAVGKEAHYYRNAKRRIGGTPDYMIHEGNRRGVLEVKTIGQRDFIDKWRGGDPEGEIIPEMWQLIQIQTYMWLTNSTFGKVAVMPVSDWAPLDVHIVDVPRKPEIIEELLKRVDRFWEQVRSGVPPEFNLDKDTAAIKALFGAAKPGKQIDLRSDSEMQLLLDWREKYKSIEKANKKDLERVENSIRLKLGDCESALVDGWFAVELKNVHRKEYTVAETDFRQFHIVRSKL
jgi:predicted phage-related endonuclease